MDREPEDLEFLGTVGIVGEAFKILRSSAKLQGAITLTLILPLSFAILGHDLVSKYLPKEIRLIGMFYQVVAGNSTMKELTGEWIDHFLFQTAYAVYVLVFLLLSTAAVVYTVASIYRGIEISYVRVMRIVPSVWKRLIVTFLWYFSIVFAYYDACVTAFIITVNLDDLNTVVFIVCVILIISVFSCGYVYISMMWHLACVISVLEDKYGLGALRKSNDLFKGKRITALVLQILYLIFALFIVWFFKDAVLDGVGSAKRGAYGTVLVGSLCFVHLMGLLTQSVFYFVCKSYHHEIIDKSSLLDHYFWILY